MGMAWSGIGTGSSPLRLSSTALSWASVTGCPQSSASGIAASACTKAPIHAPTRWQRLSKALPSLSGWATGGPPGVAGAGGDTGAGA